MKKILGLDLGTTSIGWALVSEKENETEKSAIIKTGVRIIQMDNFVSTATGKESKDPLKDFLGGNGISPNAGRTAKRGARRSLQRYKLRRKELVKILKENNLISDEFVLAEDGKNTTHSLWKLRAQAATEEVSLNDFARILLAINKKRGYKSNRKAKDDGDGQAIDGMEVAKKLYKENLTPGQYVLDLLTQDKKNIPEFYRSDLQDEFNKIWEFQKQFYSDILTSKLNEELKGKRGKAVWAICEKSLKEKDFELVGVKRETKGRKQKEENYQWRVDGLTKQLTLEQLVIVFQEINGQISKSSGYLGEISDRSKKLIIEKLTVGQYLYKQIKENPHTRLKNQVFYRQDYLDEFEKIWGIQAKYHKELTQELKKDIRDIVIFYQRRLKSQKGLISICELEGREAEIKDKDGKPILNAKGEPKRKIIGPRVIPKSSPLFQEFKIWSILNNLKFTELKTKTTYEVNNIDEDLEIRKQMFEVLNINGKMTSKDILKATFNKPEEWELKNYNSIEGNNTNQTLYKAYNTILDLAGYENINATDKDKTLKIFDSLEIKKEILDFDAELEGKDFEQQLSYQLWHLLYSYEGDNSKTGNEKLFYHLKEKFGFEKEYAKPLINISFKDDYGNLSAKAIKKIIPYLKAGHIYSEAATLAGYNHSHSVTKEENENRILKDELELLTKNSLRNPVVEKILNQMVNVVNAIIKEYGKPDEIRIELARELKKSAKERKETTEGINTATKIHNDIRKKLIEFYPFNTGVRITKKDIIKYKLWQELESNGYKTIYTDTYVELGKLFTKEFDVEHIIPKAVLFDDSFSNKTLSVREFNRWKSSKTGIDAIIEKYQKDSEDYKRYVSTIENLFKDKKISKAKYRKLLMKGSEIPDGFIERDLRNTQYIAKKAKEMLENVSRSVVPVTGSVTAKLREDWQLINVMQELNWDKYDKIGLTKYEINKEGKKIPRIIDWTKRNDHRHHAMDAITIAFTKHNHIQYFNYLNARKDDNHKLHKNIIGIEEKETYYNEDKNKLLMKPPMPINEFRAEAKKHLEQTLISFKAKNKVVTRNKNKTKGSDTFQETLTPRGQLHKETVYGKSKYYETKLEKVGTKFNEDKIKTVAKKSYREALLKRLEKFDNDPKKAFGGKNALTKNPIYLDDANTIELPKKVKIVITTDRFTIRKNITPDLFKDSKKNDIFSKKIYDENFIMDKGIRNVLNQRYSDTKKEVEAYNKTVEKKKQKKVLETAFTNLEENPIWLNKEKCIQLKRVTITGVSNAEALHTKKDQYGKELLDKEGNTIPVDYVSTGNNHHVAIYRDEKGNLQEEVVSFYDAVARVNANTPIIWKQHPEHPDWKFLFTMKQNEMFIFPNKKTGFDPIGIDLMDENNNADISPNLFRVQKISAKNYMFRHHLETIVGDKAMLKDVAFINYRNTDAVKDIIKVHINHIGKIVKVGE